MEQNKKPKNKPIFLLEDCHEVSIHLLFIFNVYLFERKSAHKRAGGAESEGK